MFGKTKVRHRSTPGLGIFRPYHRPGARAAAVLLSFCVAFTMMPTPVFAVTQDRAAETGLCEHHPEHDGECGYQEAEPGHPCEHKHTADCYTDELTCGYIEDEDVTASDSDAGHKHTQDCYELDCPHERGEHTEDCGYTEGEAGTPCGYVCDQCDNPDKDGGNGNTIGGNNPPVQEETRPELAPNSTEDMTVTAFDELDEAVRSQTVKAGTSLEELTLPKTLSATVQSGAEDPEPVVIEGVVWEPDALYEGEPGEFIFTASASGYTPAQGVEWPVITVTVEEAAAVPDEIETLCAAIDALPTVEELYENAPGDADSEFDDWVAEISSKLAEVPTLWEQLLPLSEDAAAMERITEARAEKLAALNNLAERLGEMKPKADTPTTPTVLGTMIFANGAEIKIVAGTTDGQPNTNTNILYDKNSDRTIGDTEYLKIGNTEPTAGGYDLSAYLIYGGSQDADVDGVTKITMTGGKVFDIYGGGRAVSADADVKGTELNLSGGLVGSKVYGGGQAYSSGKTASVTGDTSITLSGDVAVDIYVCGGGYAGSSNQTATVTGNAAIIMEGGKVGKSSDAAGRGIHGGGFANKGGISTVGSASVEMTGGTAVAVYGGGWAGNNSQDTVTGDVFVSLSGDAKVSGGVYGGGYIASGGTSTAGSKTVTVGNDVKIGGSTAKGIVIDGGTASVANGVDSFVIDSDLTENAGVNVQLPAGYDITSNPTIATGAVTGDLEKITLVGSGAEGKEAYFESNEIKVRAKSSEAVPAPTVNDTNIYANGVPLLLAAGSSDPSKTVVYIDKGTIGQLDEGTDEIFDPDGSGATYDGTAAGNDLSQWIIYGGSLNQDVTSTQITMTGGKIYSIYGGGEGRASRESANVTGNTSVKISGGVVSSTIYAGGMAYENASANVTQNTNLEITGGEIGGGVSGGGFASYHYSSATVGGSSTVAISGTAVIKGRVFGGGYANSYSAFNVNANVTGAATVTISGNAEVQGSVYPSGRLFDSNNNFAVHSDGNGNSATVGEGSSITVSGGVEIGNGTSKGIIINGGSPTEFKTGVDSFAIDPDLTGADGSVNVVLPAGYDVSSNPTIATGAVEADLAKITLVGSGAEGNEAYFDSGSSAIKVRAKTVVPAHTHAMSVDCSTVEGTQVDFDKALTAETTSISASGNYYLTEDVTIADKCLKITGAGVVINLCLNGHTLTAGNASSQVIQVVDGATLHLCDCQPDATNNTAITDPTTDQSVTVTGGLITGGKFPASNAFDSSTIGIIGAITGTDGEKHAALHLYGGTVAGNVSNNDTVEVMRGSFTLHGGRLAYNTSRNGGVCIWSNGNAVIVGGAIEHNHVTDPHNSVYTAVYLSGSDSALLTLSGQPVIRGNTRGTEKTPGNLYLGEAWVSSQLVGKTMLIGENFAPTEQIGIVTELEPTQDSPVPITGTNSADYSAYFKSDDPAYVIQNGEGNVVQLALPEAAKSTDATLSALAYKVGADGQETPVPDFAADTAAYGVTLPYDTSATASIILSGTPNDRGASITENNGATLENGSGQATVTVTAEDGTTTKTYTVNFITAQPTSYTVAIDGGVTNGTVSASPTSAAAGTEVTLTVTPANGYELDALSVYKTGEAGTTVTVSNNKFTMPSYNVTVTATFKKTADQTAVESAKSIIEGGAYSVAQATANSADDVKTWLATTINNLSGMSATGITVQADSITVSDFTAAQADTTGSGGSNGSFKFTVSLSKNGAAATTTSKTGIITKTPYNPPQKSDAKEITGFEMPGHVGTIFINQVKHTITVPMPAGTNVTSLTPTITVSDKASVNPASGTAQDFTSPVTYTVTAENGTTQTYTVTVTVAPTITTQTLPGGTVGTAYSHTLAADGTAPVTWSVSEGSLPDGLNLNIGTGVISGTPSTEGTSTFTVKAENSAGNDTRQLSIRIDAPAPAVTGVTVSPATASIQKGNTKQFSAEVTGTNNPAQTVTWSLEGSHADSTMITVDGLLTVASDEIQSTLTVKATSTADTSKSGTATVTVTEVPPAPTYAVSGSIKGSDTGSGIAAVLQLKDSENANVGTPVTAGADGSYTITGIPVGTYHIEVSLTGYDSGTIDGIVVSNGDVTGRDLTLHKTVTFIPVTDITMTNAATVEVNTDLALTGTITPDNVTNRIMVWTVADAGGTGAVINGSTFRAAAAGTVTVKAAIANGLTASTPYEKTFTITVTAAPVTTHTITASAGSGGTILPNGTVTVNEGESRTFTITPDSGYRISKVTVDGADKGTVTTYTFEHVTADHSISVVFDRISGGSSSDGGGTSSGGGSSSGGSSSTAPSTITSTTAGENGTSTSTTQTTSKDSSGKTTTVTTQVTKDAAGNTAGSATTVTTDNIITSADQGSAVVMVKPDGAAINSATQAAGATAASPMDILVAVPQDMVRSELQKADVSAVRMEVIIPKSVENNPTVGTAGVTVEKETVDAAKQTGKTVTVTVRDDTMAVKAVWSLDGQSMRNAAGQSTDLNLGIHTAPVQSSDPIATPVKPTVTAVGQENGLVISLTADGTLLSAAKLTVPATNQTAITAGSTVALYQFDQTTGTLRAVSGGIYPVDANGNVTIDIPAGTRMGAKETYVLLPVTGAVGSETAGTGAVGTGSGTTHTVRKGDTLNQISKQYGCKVEDLLALNPGVDIYNLQVGSDLKVR